MTIRAVAASDAERIAEIYNHYVRETVVTFEEEPVPVAEMAQRIAAQSAEYPFLVIEADGAVAGYACASSWKRRSAYRFAAESTIYLAPDCTRRGLGRPLYQALLAAMRERGLHCAIGGIALPNPDSIRLHERLGFAPIGRFQEVGFKFNRWIDVGYWEKLL